jgi:hypothetical protein
VSVQRDGADGVFVGSVDKFQGGERSLMTMSTVRCNANGNLVFVAAAERICVAFTRGKHGFVVFGDAATLYDGDKRGAWRPFLKTAATEGFLLQGKVAATEWLLLEGRARWPGVHACLNLKELERLEYSHLRNLVGQAPERMKEETADENERGQNKWEAIIVWGQSLQRFRVAGEVQLGLRQELLCFGSQLAGAKIVLLLEVLSALPEHCYGVYDRPEDPLDWDQKALSYSGEMTIARAPRDICTYFLYVVLQVVLAGTG